MFFKIIEFLLWSVIKKIPLISLFFLNIILSKLDLIFTSLNLIGCAKINYLQFFIIIFATLIVFSLLLVKTLLAINILLVYIFIISNRSDL